MIACENLYSFSGIKLQILKRKILFCDFIILNSIHNVCHCCFPYSRNNELFIIHISNFVVKWIFLLYHNFNRHESHTNLNWSTKLYLCLLKWTWVSIHSGIAFNYNEWWNNDDISNKHRTQFSTIWFLEFRFFFSLKFNSFFILDGNYIKIDRIIRTL